MTSSAVSTGLRLPPAIAAALLAHARRELPNEACGLLAGAAASGAITAFHPARNEHASPLRFSLDAQDLVRLTYAIEAAQLDLLAIFHSHPGGAAVPSPTDVREARHPEAVHVLGGGDLASRADLRAWRIRDGTAIEVPLAIG